MTQRKRERERQRETQSLNQLSIHQWVRSAIHASQQLTSPIVSYHWNFCHRLVRYWYINVYDVGIYIYIQYIGRFWRLMNNYPYMVSSYIPIPYIFQYNKMTPYIGIFRHQAWHPGHHSRLHQEFGLVPGWFGGCWRHNLAVPAICPFIRGCLVDIKIAGGCIEIFNHLYIWKNIEVLIDLRVASKPNSQVYVVVINMYSWNPNYWYIRIYYIIDLGVINNMFIHVHPILPSNGW